MPTTNPISARIHRLLRRSDAEHVEHAAALTVRAETAEATAAQAQDDVAQVVADLSRTQEDLEQTRVEFAAYVAAHPEPSPPPPPEDPRAPLVAVRVFPSYRDKVYGQHAAVLDLLGDLGIKRISHKITPAIAGDKATLDFTRAAYERHGIKSWLTVGEPLVTLNYSDWDEIVAALSGPLAGMVDMVSGWNEPNHVRGGGTLPTDWAARTVQHQRMLHHYGTELGIPVGTPQLWSGSLAQHDADVRTLAAAGLAGHFDTIAWHLYPRGGVGIELLDRFQATYRTHWSATAPIVCTEAGYLDAANYVGGAANMTPATKAQMVPQLVESYVSRGHGISYFELLDDPDPTEADREASLGLVECPSLDPATWTPKPSFHALKTYLTAR